MSEIRKELEKACKVEQADETAAEYLIVLAEAGEELSDKKWDGLTEEAQEWINNALTALDAEDSEIANFPDAEEVEEDPEPAEEEEKPVKKRRGSKKKVVAPVPEPEPEDEVEEDLEVVDAPEDEEKPKKKAKPPKARKNSAISRIQYFTCKHPNFPVEKVGEKVRKEFPDVAEATIRIQYSITHNIMCTLTEMGWSQ